MFVTWFTINTLVAAIQSKKQKPNMQERVYFSFLKLIPDRNNLLPVSWITKLYSYFVWQFVRCFIDDRADGSGQSFASMPIFQYSHGSTVLKLQAVNFTALYNSSFLNSREMVEKATSPLGNAGQVASFFRNWCLFEFEEWSSVNISVPSNSKT